MTDPRANQKRQPGRHTFTFGFERTARLWKPWRAYATLTVDEIEYTRQSHWWTEWQADRASEELRDELEALLDR